MPSEPATPPPERLTLAEIDPLSLTIEAACSACPDWREVTYRPRHPGWADRPIVDTFADGRMPCQRHGRPANRLRFRRFVNAMVGHEMVGAWERPEDKP